MAAPETPSVLHCNRKAAIREMVRGRELAEQLRVLLRGRSGDGGRPEQAQELAVGLMDSFSAALSALGRVRPGRSAWTPAGGEGKVRKAGERRRGQTRRSQPYAWTRVTSETLDDGHTWRKYGQKDIHGAENPRCYFRCKYKHDQGCQAARQVQKSEDDPSKFEITYLGHHTCKRPTASLRPGLGPGVGVSSPISFGPPSTPAGGDRDPLPPAAPSPPPKQDAEDDARSPTRIDSLPEYLMLPELTPLATSEPMTGISSAGSDAGDVTSVGLHTPCVSTCSLAVDGTWESVLFEDMFGLEHSEFAYEFFSDESTTALTFL